MALWCIQGVAPPTKNGRNWSITFQAPVYPIRDYGWFYTENVGQFVFIVYITVNVCCSNEINCIVLFFFEHYMVSSMKEIGKDLDLAIIPLMQWLSYAYIGVS